MSPTQLVLILTLGGILQGAALVCVLIWYTKRSSVGARVMHLEARVDRGFDAVRAEMREREERLRRYVDESVSTAMVESQTRDTDLRAYVDAVVKELRDLPRQVKDATIEAINVVMQQRADEKGRTDAAIAGAILGTRHKGGE